MSDLMELFTTKMAAFEAELHSKTSTNPTTTMDLAAEFTSFRSFIISALGSLQQQVELLSHEVDRLEMRGRRKILLVHNIPEEKQEEPGAAVMKIFAGKLKVPGITDNDIGRCHRLGRSSASKTRPILVEFSSVVIKDKVWFSKTNLKGSGITLSEFLTVRRHTAFSEARVRFGIQKCWTRDGYVFVLAPDGTRHQIVSLAELNMIPCPTVSDNAAEDVASEVQKPSKPAVTRARRATTLKKW